MEDYQLRIVKMKKLLFLIIPVITGCSTTDYTNMLAAHSAIEIAKANAEKEKMAALREVARTGDVTAKVAVAMALAGAQGTPQATQLPAPPRSWDEKALSLVSVLTPLAGVAVQGYSARQNTLVQIESTRANKDIQINQAQMWGNIVTTGFNTNAAIVRDMPRPTVTTPNIITTNTSTTNNTSTATTTNNTTNTTTTNTTGSNNNSNVTCSLARDGQITCRPS